MAVVVVFIACLLLTVTLYVHVLPYVNTFLKILLHGATFYVIVYLRKILFI